MSTIAFFAIAFLWKNQQLMPKKLLVNNLEKESNRFWWSSNFSPVLIWRCVRVHSPWGARFMPREVVWKWAEQRRRKQPKIIWTVISYETWGMAPLKSIEHKFVQSFPLFAPGFASMFVMFGYFLVIWITVMFVICSFIIPFTPFLSCLWFLFLLVMT